MATDPTKIRKVIEAINELNDSEKSYLRGYFAMSIDEEGMNRRLESFLKAT